MEADSNAISVKTHMDMVEVDLFAKNLVNESRLRMFFGKQNMTKAATVQLSQFKKNIDTLKKEVHEMYQVIMIRNEEIQKSMIPVLENSLENLRRQIDLQDKENEALEAQSEGIESEMADVSQLCEECLDHMRHLEEEVGSYTS